NSQCTLNMAGTGVSLSGNTLTFTVAVTFSASYSGLKNVYLWAGDNGGANTGWQTRGSWTVGTAMVSVTAESVTPASGMGQTQAFVLQYTDGQGAGSLGTVWVVFSGSSNSPAPNTCGAYYSRAANMLYLDNDAANAAAGAAMGGVGTLQNGQCAVNMVASSV